MDQIKERMLLMELLLDHGAAPSATEMRVFKTVKYFGKEVLDSEQLRVFEDLFKRAKPRLTKDQLASGRKLGIYVSPEEEHIFGRNIVYVGQHQRLPPDVACCRDPQCNVSCRECREVVGMVSTIVNEGGFDSFSEAQIEKAERWGLIVTSQWQNHEQARDNEGRISCRRGNEQQLELPAVL